MTELPAKPKRSASVIGRQNRARGSSYELEVARDLHALTGFTFKRNLEQVRDDAQGDLVTDDAAWPFTLEMKRRASGTGCTAAWRAQASAAARKACNWPAVVYRFDRQGSRVSVPMEAVGAAFGGTPGDCTAWVETDLDGLAYLARELMARAAQ